MFKTFKTVFLTSALWAVGCTSYLTFFKSPPQVWMIGGKESLLEMKFPKQSEYPKQIYHKDEVYKIKFVKKLKYYGETDSGEKEIRIKAGISPRETFKTLIHELFHVMEFEGPIQIKHKTVYELETAVFEIICDNFL